MGLKDIYHAGEDKWYQFLDSVDHALPVYRVIDPIDKVIPSFVVALGLLVIILGLIALPFLGGNTTRVVFTVTDGAGNTLSGIDVTATYGNTTLTKTTSSVGKVSFDGIPVGVLLEVRAQSSTYGNVTNSFTISANDQYTLSFGGGNAVSETLTFQFIDNGSLSLAGKTLEVNLLCSSGVILPTSKYIVTNGVLTITPPADCGNLVGTVSGNGIETKEGILFTAGNPLVTLSPLVVEKGKIKATIHSGETNQVVPNVDVELFSANGVSFTTITTNSFGVAIFPDVPVGNYYTSTQDPSGTYALTQGDAIIVLPNQTVSTEIYLEKQVQGSISVVVVDKTANTWLANSTVKLVRVSDDKLLATQTTATGQASIAFDVNEKGPFAIYVLHDGYLSQSKETGIVSGNQTLTFALEKLTASNSGKITVSVKDEDNFPVDNAQLILYNADTGFILHKTNPVITDSNGTGTFKGVPSGTYFVRATKYPAGPSDSPTFTSEASVPKETSILLQIGNGFVQTTVKDVDGNPIPFAIVEYRTAGSDECLFSACSEQTDAQGITTKSFKADRKVYVRVRATGYAPFTTQSYQLFAGQTNTIAVSLEKAILGSTPSIRFVKLVDPVTGTNATELKKGKSYHAVFHVRVPTAINPDNGGAHIRVGDDPFMENDPLRIISINAPATTSIKGTTYQPNPSFDADEENITNGEAKWVNIHWNDFESGVYEIGIDMRVMEQSAALDPLPIYFRAWSEEDNVWLRDPYDSILGTSSDSPARDTQYAETYQKIYYSGKPIVCGEAFCYSGESILNEDDSILVDGPPYSMSVNKLHTYTFVLTSASPVIYENPKLRVFATVDGKTPAENVLFQSYDVTGTTGQNISAQGLSTEDIPGGEGQGIQIGRLEQFQTISGNYSFITKKTGPVKVVVQLINNGEIVFQQSVDSETLPGKKLSIDVTPETATSFLPTDFSIHVIDEQGFDVQDALISLLKIDPNKAQQFVDKKYTLITGKTELVGPASLPRTHFVFDAVKGGYESAHVEIIVDENIVKFTPTKMDFSLPNAPNAEQLLPLKITNLSQEKLLVTKALVSGEFKGLLSNAEMANYLKQYQGVTSLEEGSDKTIQVKASTSASVNVIASQQVSGDAIFTIQSVNSKQEWVQNVPLNVQIKVLGSCDDEAIQLSGVPAAGTLQTTSFDSKNQTPFQIGNTCQTNGKPVPLKNLKAKLVWKSNPIGNVELAVNDIEGIQQSIEVLKNGNFVTLFGDFRSVDETIYESILTFTPFPNHIGETAEFTITIAGELGTPAQPITVQKSFDAKIKITNLETCVVFDPEPEHGIVLKADGSSVDFKIDTSNCGVVPVDISLCAGSNNANCSGGAPEGRLYVSDYTLTNVTGSKTITVERKGGTLPGAYDITVDARVPGTSFSRIASINVEVESDSSYAFSLDKGAFTLYQQGAQDAATVINSLFIESVKVTASVCDWDKASKSHTTDNFAKAQLYGSGAATITYGGALFAGYGASLTLFATAGIVGAAVFIAILAYETTQDPCDKDFTSALPDYIINLKEGDDDKHPSDAISVTLSSNAAPYISGEWNTEVVNAFKEDGIAKQSAGIVFTNKTGYSNANPLFGVVTLNANEHINGDPIHGGSAKVKCTNGNFYSYNIGEKNGEGNCNTKTESRAEKFHVKFKTQEVDQSLPQLTFDQIACNTGSSLGASGEGALPKISLNWSWSDASGIGLYACDADNPDAIYCDATQLNISIMKRLHAVDEFLAANNYSFTCPDNPNAQPLNADYPNTEPLVTNSVGMSSVGYSFNSATSITFRSTVKNTTITPQTVNVTITPGTEADNPPVVPTSCVATSIVPANSETTVSCTITGFGISGQYYAKYALSSTTTTNISYANPIVLLSTKSVQEQNSGSCEDIPRTTALVNNSPGINYWIDKTDPTFGDNVNQASVTWTATIPDIQTLNKLTHFDALLIRDGYTADFENDFKKYYTSNSFADAPIWYKGTTGASGFSSYYDATERLYFTNKYFTDSILPAAGQYRIDLDVFFGEDWRFFDTNSSPAGQVSVVFYHQQNPSPNSPFYRLPFDGLVGIEGTTLQRVGYGSEYINTKNDTVKINDSFVQSYEGADSSAISQVTISQKNDLRSLNSIPSTRGNLLEVTSSTDNLSNGIVFTPSLATPVMMKVTHGVTPNPFAAYYYVSQAGVPEDAGNTLTYWEGAGNCYDYSGLPIYEKFNFSPDRAGTPADKYGSWPYLYAVDWDNALVGGDAYLRTIFYTPPNGTYQISSEGGTASFFTSNHSAPAANQLLDGISTLPYDNASQTIDSLQDVFDLVGNGKICVSNTGTKTRFFWNPETVYKQTSQTSISAATNTLIAGNTCLGPTN